MRTILKGWVYLLIPFSVSVEAARPLDSGTLDQVTASGVNPQLNWIQREGETVAASGATAEVELVSNTTLQGSVQNDVNAQALVNVASSDSAQLLNIAFIDDGTNKTEQTNYLEQDASFVGRLGRTLSGGPTVFYSYSYGYNNLLSQGSSEGVIQIDNTLTSSLEQEITTAAVTKWDPTKDFTIPLGKWDSGSVSLGKLGINLIYDSEIAGSYGLALTTRNDITLSGPKLDLGEVQFLNDDLILRPGSFTLPSIDFNYIDFTYCVATCKTESTYIGRVLGTSISPFKDEYISEGDNPSRTGMLMRVQALLL